MLSYWEFFEGGKFQESMIFDIKRNFWKYQIAISQKVYTGMNSNFQDNIAS